MDAMGVSTNLLLIDADLLSFSFWCKIFKDLSDICGASEYSDIGNNCIISINVEEAGLAFAYWNNAGTIDELVTTLTLLEHNTWYHCCFTFNKGVSKWYINGEEQTLATNTLNAFTLDIPLLYIGTYDMSMNESTTPLISDFRVYVTALTEEDIKELYQTTMTIDDNNNLYARELTNDIIEGISATRQGLLRAEHFNETSIAKFNKDKTVESNYFYEY